MLQNKPRFNSTMKLNTPLLILLGVVILGGLFFVFKPKTQQTDQQNQSTNSVSPQQSKNPNTTTEIATIRMTSNGFDPSSLTIQKGTKVIFKNEDTQDRWPASAMHPTHTRYPGSGIEKCGTPEEKNIFDACRGITTGKEYSFIFNKAGEWSYHDHLMPSFFGKVNVVENLKNSQDTTKKTFTLQIQKNNRVSGPETISVVQGDEVTIRIITDASGDELHLHGYNKSVKLEKDKEVSLTFTANLTGRFEAELENAKTSITVLEVQPK